MQVGRDDRTHDGELHEVIVVAVGVSAKVEHHRVTRGRRYGGDDCRTIDARHHAEHEPGSGEQGAGVAGGNAGRRVALLDEVDRDAHRRVLLAAEGILRPLVHADDFGGFDETAAPARERRAEQRTHDFAAADDDQPQVGSGR